MMFLLSCMTLVMHVESILLAGHRHSPSARSLPLCRVRTGPRCRRPQEPVYAREEMQIACPPRPSGAGVGTGFRTPRRAGVPSPQEPFRADSCRREPKIILHETALSARLYSAMILTKQQLQHLEQRLLEERARVTAMLERQELATETETPSEAAGDIAATRVDRGTESQFQELDVINAKRATEELADIDAALDRFYNNPDAFGRDERTGQPIPFARLDIIPWART